ncbi:MAG: hypothetical protein Q4A07_07140 [Coriobacteriales bacterium]|nr:hypothetical protein [Coriobacteriales bacterium]
MIASFTDTFNIDKNTFDRTGAYDPVIGVDSRLFVDPALLELSQAPEFDKARQEVESYFGIIIRLVRDLECQGDRRWRKAEKLLTFTEIRGTSLGYCGDGNAGSGIGPRLRKSILESIGILIDCGIENPTVFELLGVFEEGVGSDRISDLITHILRKRIAGYTERVSRKLGYTSSTMQYEGHLVPRHPARDEPILLLPRDILSPLPIATGMEDIDWVCAVNERVRSVINQYFPWDEQKIRLSKAEIKKLMLEHPEFAAGMIETYSTIPRHAYDFVADDTGEASWYRNGQSLARRNPLDLSMVDRCNPMDVARAVCKQFKHLVEDNGAWRLLFNEDESKPRTERYAQNLFLAISSTYCLANDVDIDVSPEPNSGNGPVDFKLSRGRMRKCLVELKMSSSGQLRHCVDEQIPSYLQAEGTNHSIYLLVQTGNEKRVESFVAYYQGLSPSTRKSIELIVVDARPKKSASKR